VPKARPHPNQLGFAFEPPRHAVGPAALAGLERRIAGMVGTILNSDTRSRKVIAAEMSELLGDDDVSEAMLNAYAAPSRPDHKVPMSRALSLVAVTERHDLLDRILREIGAAVLVGEEIKTARLGHLDRQIAQLQAERKTLADAPLIRSGGQD
jgi:hypothetical protein